MNILITNTVLLNSGDAAILEGEIRLLRRVFGSSAQFRIHDAQPDVARRLYPTLNLHHDLYRRLFRTSSFPLWERGCARLERVFERPAVARFYLGAWLYGRRYQILAKLILTSAEFMALEEYAAADMIVSTGGTYLVETYDLRARIVELMTSVLLRKPLLLYTQSLGPFHNPRYRKRLSIIFNHAALILLRDERSREHVRELGVGHANLVVTADAAFALADTPKWQNTPRPELPLRIALSVRMWAHFTSRSRSDGQARYVESIIGVITDLVMTHRATVVLISTCQGVPEYAIDDSQLARELYECLDTNVSEHVKIDSEFHSPGELMTRLADFDLVISTRMHMAILALNAGTPAVAIAYEFKTKELFRELGDVSLAYDIETITPEAMIQSINDVLTNLPRIRDMLRRATLRQLERVEESGKHVKDTYQRFVQASRK